LTVAVAAQSEAGADAEEARHSFKPPDLVWTRDGRVGKLLVFARASVNA
jgi:hypothetical protein